MDLGITRPGAQAITHIFLPLELILVNSSLAKRILHNLLSLYALSALNFLSKQKISFDTTILYGESLGCGKAAKLSSENTFAATILEAPYTSIADVAQRHYWFLPAKWLVLDRYEILEIINNIKSPLMVIHGEQDNVISIEFGKQVFDAAPEPKEALFIPNAGHNNLFEFYADEKILVYVDKQINY